MLESEKSIEGAEGKMTSLASREMTEQEMINTCTAPQMAHLIQVLRQTIRNKDKEIERWVDMVSQLQRDGKLDPSEVVVHIGCLKGTVAPGYSDATIMIVPIGYNGFGDVGIIPVAMLDALTRSLVEKLLKAQEEQ